MLLVHNHWNNIGYPLNQPQNVRDAFTPILPNLVKVIGDGKNFDPNLPDALNTLTTLEPGKGYLVKVSEDVNLIYPEPTAILTAKRELRMKAAETIAGFNAPAWTPVTYPTPDFTILGNVVIDGDNASERPVIAVLDIVD